MPHPQPPQPVQELVINWHITEACNYRCRYCFAQWTKPGRELIHDTSNTVALLEELFHYFSPDNARNPLRREMAWESLRLNLAGGEPLLYGGAATQVIKLARSIGFKTSLISNGSRLSPTLMAELAPHLDMLGLSLDSTDTETNQAIGRADQRVLDLCELRAVIACGRRLNPGLRLKINTVVNAFNWREDMAKLISDLAPDKWKVLRMLPTLTDDLAISDAEFQAFIQRHQCLNQIICAEDNVGMAESYLMLDPYGRFFQNRLGQQGYEYSEPIPAVGVATALSQTRMSADKFRARYAMRQTGMPA